MGFIKKPEKKSVNIRTFENRGGKTPRMTEKISFLKVPILTDEPRGGTDTICKLIEIFVEKKLKLG